MSSPGKYNFGDLVWAKLKGFSIWPGQVVDGSAINIKIGRKPKNSYCVRFFGSNDYAWIGKESIYPYEQHREQYSKSCKSVTFKKALRLSEDQFIAIKGDKSYEPLSVLLNHNEKKASLSTPQPVKSTDPFNSKKANTASASVQRDYSRTPFKRSDTFETPTKRELKTETKIDNKKRLRLSPSIAKKEVDDSNLNDDYLSDEPTTNNIKLNKVKPRCIEKPSNLKFGFIGLGKVGQQVLKHILSAGHEVSIWNRTPSKCKEFEKLGASVMKTPGDVIRAADITFSCLTDSEASSSIFFGNCGVSSEINASKGYVELTSMDPSTSVEIEIAINERGGRYLEAPLIYGYPQELEEGKVLAVVAGNRSLFDDCNSCFEAICSHVYFLDECVGAAAKMSIVISSLYGNINGIVMESMTLVERLGLLTKDFVEIISKSSFSSSFLKAKATSILDNTLVRDIAMAHIRRNFNYTLGLANTKTFSTPITATTNEVFKQKFSHYF